jgi:type III pantothenate kinase
MKIIAVDAGNSHLRFSIVDSKTLECGERVFCSYEDFEDKLATIISTPHYCSLSTVVESAKVFFEEISINSPLIKKVILCSTQNSALKIEYNRKTIGIDRVVDAVAALKLYPQRDLIVIDSGTATTVDAVNVKSTFLGGFILPGLKLKAESLFEKTDKLPKTDLYNLTLSDVPKTTKDAIVSGLILDSVGGIEKAVSSLLRSLENPVIIGCGGGWEILESYLPSNYITYKNLTLLGTALLGEFMLKEKENETV